MKAFLVLLLFVCNNSHALQCCASNGITQWCSPLYTSSQQDIIAAKYGRCWVYTPNMNPVYYGIIVK